MIYILLVIVIGCYGCKQGKSETISQIPYESKEAIKRGDVVQIGITVYNFDRFNQFITNYHKKKTDKVRITSYTIEGDPIFIDLDYDGETIEYINDNSNDAYGTKEINKVKCTKMEKKTNGQRKVEYFVSSCSKTNNYSVLSIDQRDFQYKQPKE